MMKKNLTELIKITIPVVFLLCSFHLPGEEYYIQDYAYFLDLPENWEILDASDPGKLSFTDESRSAVLQIISFSGDRFQSAGEIHGEIGARLNAEGEGAGFIFSGRDAYFSDISFHEDNYRVRGYFISINGRDNDFALLTFSPVDKYDELQDFLLSALDSFSLEYDGRYRPGPVSQFYYPFPGSNPEPVEVAVNGENIRLPVDRKELEAAQVVVEREARILAAYSGNRVNAWQRYYRMIYKDNYHRLDSFSDLVFSVLKKEGLISRDAELPLELLSWIQGFTYFRTGTLADLLSPLSTAYTASGDCDSRALLYIILLHHLGTDSILLVSSQYSHSVAGVNISGLGARVRFEGRNYLIAEVTEQVDIGLIPRNMANASGWIPVRLGDF